LFAEDLTQIDWDFYFEIARRIPNRFRVLNRTLLNVACKTSAALNRIEIVARTPVDLSRARTALLRRADHIVHTFQREAGIYDEIWQFPTVLAPAGLAGSSGESIILRPIISIDAMTASVYRMRPEHLNELARRLIALDGVDLVFYDLTSKPPGTIEWE
jgi:GMP synthase (glutamine-hydrolysing)